MFSRPSIRRLIPALLLITPLAVFVGWLYFQPEQTRHTAGAQSGQATNSVIFAGGCFWCVESDFDKVPGVLATTSGYSGGTTVDPTYREVVGGGTGHYEVVKIDYDANQVSFDQLLTAFWHSTNPTDPGGQFCDRGQSYATAVFVEGDERATAEASKAALIDRGFDIVTPILDRAPFYAAEDYHQDYYLKNPTKYAYYRYRCGRNATVKKVWGDEAYKGIPKDE